jgi:hypothetical protein
VNVASSSDTKCATGSRLGIIEGPTLIKLTTRFPAEVPYYYSAL